MKNIFAARKDFVEGRKRNTFDLSFQNNLTMRFGRLYPVFCKEVLPGDSFRIKPSFGLRFMPLVFPIQTRMQANLHFFYVRNRTLWKDWMDFIGRTKDGLVPPYIAASIARDLFKTGALGDYFGVPTTLVGDYGSKLAFNPKDYLLDISSISAFNDPYVNYYLAGDSPATVDALGIALSTVKTRTLADNSDAKLLRGMISPEFDITKIIKESDGARHIRFRMRMTNTNNSNQGKLKFHFFMPYGENDYAMLGKMYTGSLTDGIGIVIPANAAVGDSVVATSAANSVFKAVITDITTAASSSYCEITCDLNIDGLTYLLRDGGDTPNQNTYSGLDAAAANMVDRYGSSNVRLCICMSSAVDVNTFSPITTAYWAGSWRGVLNVQMAYDVEGDRDISNYADVFNPYVNGDIKISALPFRAYEAIYNAYYRNQLNDPFKINGTPEYNKYITNDAGGADSTVYDFFNRNWELDFLTSATQTPQQGDITPLVGVSASGQFTFDNGDGTTTTVTPTLGSDGATLTGIAAYEGSAPADGSLPAGVRRLQQLIPYGISINDFRNVNALQRWLETNLRRGYKYRDQIKSHFDVDVEYKELDMPEFIGGMSEPVLVNQINQSVDQTEAGYGDFGKVLGSYAGQASILAQSEHDISHYCDEHGFIIGIMSISPVPNYSQLLPKQLIKDNVLDYYFPEFGHIGNQPVTYREVCPLQSYAAGDDVDDVFGYQRAWYDYIASVDEVHGDMRLSLRNFLINRVFNSRPELGAQFLQVDNDQINDVFSVTEQTDKIIGQIYFDVTAQREIPKFGIPRLE